MNLLNNKIAYMQAVGSGHAVTTGWLVSNRQYPGIGAIFEPPRQFISALLH